MKRSECLEAARKAVEERAVQHGKPENTFAQIANLWSAFLGIELVAADAAMMMILLKVGRAQGNPANNDTWVDIAGYAACGAELTGEEGDAGK